MTTLAYEAATAKAPSQLQQERTGWLAVVVALAAVLVDIPLVSPFAGFLLLVGLPTYLLYTKVDWPSSAPSERLGFSLVSTLAGLMVMGLTMNTVLPLLGVDRPLDRLPVALVGGSLYLLLARWRRRRTPWRHDFSALTLLASKDRTILAVLGFAVLLAVAGSNRLNNGAGNHLTLIMLLLLAAAMLMLLAWSEQLRPGTVTTAVYLTALALLLMTSLRGWYSTGHDVQREFNVFQLTLTNGHWSMERWRDAYNACLSVTILPTLISRATSVADPYVFKVFFQVLFAYCPVMLYRLSRSWTSTRVALLGTIYFVAFPTFFTDMPMLNRQEVAFLYVGAALLLIVNSSTTGPRPALLAVFAVGMVVSHYSTTYIVIGTLAAALACRRVLRWRPLHRRLTSRPRVKSSGERNEARLRSQVVSFAGVACLTALAFTWSGPITHTYSGVWRTAQSVIDSVVGGDASERAPETAYGVISAAGATAAERLEDYRTAAREERRRVETVATSATVFVDEAFLDDYPTPLVADANLPATAVGRALRTAGLDPSVLNSGLRRTATLLLQVFVVVGVITALFSRRRRIYTGSEIALLAVGSLVVVVAQLVLPAISVEYGVLRAFQQALLVLSPFVALGSLTAFQSLGLRWDFRVSNAIAIAFFLSISGVIPQLLGGYPPQLHLNNDGRYYDTYYLQADEISAVQWLTNHIGPYEAGRQPGVQIESFTAHRLQSYSPLIPLDDPFPLLLRQSAYVFLGRQAVQEGQDSVNMHGGVVTYRYPIALLDSTKNLLYSSEGARVYR